MPDAVNAAAPIRIERPLSTTAVLLGGLRTLAKRPRGAVGLPELAFERPGVTVDREQLAAYCALCGFDAGAGVPILFPHLLAFPLHLRLMMHRDFPFPMAGLVHIGNRVVQHRALVPGEPVTVRAGFGRLLSHPRGQALAIRAAIEASGETLWYSESIYLRIGARDPVGPPAQLLAPDDGATGAGVCEALPASLGPRYARISGDRNPIHMSTLGARLFGFKRRIAHGMWTKARALALVLPPDAPERIAIDVSFRAPILLPGTACFHAAPDRTSFSVRDRSGARLHLIGRYDLDPSEDSHA